MYVCNRIIRTIILLYNSKGRIENILLLISFYIILILVKWFENYETSIFLWPCKSHFLYFFNTNYFFVFQRKSKGSDAFAILIIGLLFISNTYIQTAFVLLFMILQVHASIAQSVQSLGYGVDNQEIGVWFPAEVRDISLLHSVQTDFEVHQALHPMSTGGYFTRE
jgi:hypothetical protein